MTTVQSQLLILVLSLLAGTSLGAEVTPPPGMVFLEGGSFTVGTNEGFPFEGPAHEVAVKPFFIDKTEVTVGEFRRFVEATGYKTEAEELGWGGVFSLQARGWLAMDGVYWQFPRGPFDGPARDDEPVTQVSWKDANAYAAWAGKRLPTEIEFEYAARGGSSSTYYWGEDFDLATTYANLWQGSFPAENLGKDGFKGVAPVASFQPNGYGLYDITGNVWEWTSDWWSEDRYQTRTAPAEGTERVMRGGSWLCSPGFCEGYRAAARNKTAPDSALNNLGFRCVKDL